MAGRQRPNLIVDDGGDATLMVHRGYFAEENPGLLDEPTDNRNGDRQPRVEGELGWRPSFFHRLVGQWKGVSEETTTGVRRLYQMMERGELLVRQSTSTTRSPSPNSTTFTVVAIR